MIPTGAAQVLVTVPGGLRQVKRVIRPLVLP